MPGRIKFEYRSLHDVVIAYVEWHLETLDDLDVWYMQYKSYFAKQFSRKVDLILELSKFRLHPRLAIRFRDLRNRILSDYVNRSYRVKEAPKERALMYAGFVLNGGPANEFGTIEAALKALLEDRAKEAASHKDSGVEAAQRAPAGDLPGR